MAHTLTPWKHHQTSSGYTEIWGQSTKDGHVPVILCSADSGMHNPLPNEDTGNNFKFICKAVNSHQALVDALEGYLELNFTTVEGKVLSEGLGQKYWSNELKKNYTDTIAALKLANGEE